MTNAFQQFWRWLYTGLFPFTQPKKIQYGTYTVFGVKPIQPIINIPPDALKVRIRMRNDAIAFVFVKFKDRVEQWTIGTDTNTASGRWILKYQQGVNKTL